jgi:hypothetical protein
MVPVSRSAGMVIARNAGKAARNRGRILGSYGELRKGRIFVLRSIGVLRASHAGLNKYADQDNRE